MKRNWQNKFWEPRTMVTYIMQSLPKGQRGITKVYFVDELPNGSGGPACCLRSTGECWININVWRKLAHDQRVFVLLHENEHIVQNTSDELAVDREAHKKYMQMGYSLTESVKALTRVLSFGNDEHFERTKEQMIRSTVYDIQVNGNMKLLNKLKRLDNERKLKN